MSEQRFAPALGLAAVALTFGSVVTAGVAAPASAGASGGTSEPTPTLDRGTGLPAAARGVVDDWPEHEYAGDIYIAGTYGYALFDDYDGAEDRDDFYVVDMNDDGYHVSLSVYHDGTWYTGHDAGGEARMISAGNISNGETVQLKACVWNHDHSTQVGCAENELTE